MGARVKREGQWARGEIRRITMGNTKASTRRSKRKCEDEKKNYERYKRRTIKIDKGR